MEIRKATAADHETILAIYARARQYMAQNGNPTQWGLTNWPPEDLVREDIAAGNSYVCVHENRVVGVFYYVCGPDIEPTYGTIESGTWLDSSPYGVIHRIATDGSVKGVARFCFEWALQQCPHLRIDTHPDNKIMLNLLPEFGFSRRGIIHIVEDDCPRIAFEIPATKQL